jgi:hypothetical protein
MRVGDHPSVPSRSAGEAWSLPETFLSCYEILDADALRWNVRLYKARRIDGAAQGHADRGDVKQAIWGLRKKNPGLCRGYGFVIDVDAETAAVPSNWELPARGESDGYIVTLDKTFRTDPSNRSHRKVIAGILREAAKKQFKENRSDQLGTLWQDYDRFCQAPEGPLDGDYLFCRKFGFAPKALRGNRWVLQVIVTTTTVDSRTFQDYYRDGRVDQLAEMIEVKQANQVNRQNRAVAIRVLRDQSSSYQPDVAALELVSPDLIAGHGTLSRHDQASLAGGSIPCRAFGKPHVQVPLGQVRLILDAQLTGADHAETIIEPEERHQLMQHVRDMLHGMDAHGHQIPLANVPVDASAFPALLIPPPSLRVRGPDGADVLLPPCVRVNEAALHARAKDRLDHVKRNGFLLQRPINPVLACPSRFGKDRARRMKNDLNYVLRSEGIEYTFKEFMYRDVEHLNAHIEESGFDALLAVLPEGSRAPYREDDTHERIKRRVEIPSQCIHCDHTLPESWVGRPPREFRESQPKLAGRIRQRYELCLWNLLVKHHWVPFAPNDSFRYNVHVGLDVGGRHNNRAMACLGYGFSDPRSGLLFRPEEIPIDAQKVEPIPTQSLYVGLLQLFESVHQDLSDGGLVPNFDSALFFRDGGLLGDGDAWNELDALRGLHGELFRRGWVSDRSVWTAVEVMKQAEDWRLMRFTNEIANPLVGFCLMPFDDEDKALVCTTGAPYLTQGTAGPLKVAIVEVYGVAPREDVLRDLIWSADLCFTKVDVGLRLPWVLHVADAGALQSARSYKITGVTT